MSFFAVGDRYRDTYEIEAVFPFFDGELGIARSGDQRFLLQHAQLKKQAPSRAIQQYRSLDHPLILPYREVYTEERSLVFIRPYEPYQPLYDAIRQQPASEDELVRWGKSLLHMEAYLRSKPLPMYFILDPRNIGLTADGKLIVLYCGVRQITALEPSLDWGTFFYILLTGEMHEEPLDKISADAPFSKPMIRLLQKSLRNQSVDSVLSQIENYERKKKGKGLLDRLFGDQAEEEQPRMTPNRMVVPTLVPSSWKEAAERERLEQERLAREASERERLEQERLAQEAAERERLEQERLEREAAERERLEQERLEREATERERLEQERLEREASERERLEQKRLEREAAERERLEQERLEREAAERERLEQERLEREATERERLEQERLEREASERERLEQERLEREAAERERLEQERLEREAAERERLEQERLEREAAERERLEQERMAQEASERERLEQERMAREAAERERLEQERLARERLRKERLERERQEHEKLAKQFQEYMEAFYKSS